MEKKSINQVLAENLRHFMTVKKLSQMMLAGKAQIAQTTISNYLNPGGRKSKSGKESGAKLTELDRLAKGLEVEAWRLLTPLDEKQRAAYDAVEKAFQLLQQADKPIFEEDLPTPVRKKANGKGG